MKIFQLFLLLLLLISPALAQQSQTDFKYGERPRNSVFDPAGILSVKDQEAISAPLRRMLKEENIDVLVVLLPEIGDTPAEHVARGFSDQWSQNKLNSVVLHVPNNPDSPWIFPGGAMTETIKPEILERDVAAAEMRAAAEPEDFGKVRAASTEAADLLRYWAGGTMLRLEKQSTENLKAYLARENRRRLFKLAAILGAASIIPVLAGGVLLTRRIKKGGPLEFPVTRKLSRLGAPYSGGNHACSKKI